MVLGGAGGGRASGQRGQLLLNLHLLPSPSLPSRRLPAHCISEAWARPSSSVFSSGKWGEGRRLKSWCLCWSQMTASQLFTSTHCKHTCRRAGTSPALGLHPSSLFPIPDSHPRTSSPAAMLSIPQALGAGKARGWASGPEDPALSLTPGEPSPFLPPYSFL